MRRQAYMIWRWCVGSMFLIASIAKAIDLEVKQSHAVGLARNLILLLSGIAIVAWGKPMGDKACPVA